MLSGAAVGFAFDAVFALHPRLWKWANDEKRKALQQPVWKRVARAVIGGVALAALIGYGRRTAEQLREEDPELYARITEGRS
jgi:hypothetical protein